MRSWCWVNALCHWRVCSITDRYGMLECAISRKCYCIEKKFITRKLSRKSLLCSVSESWCVLEPLFISWTRWHQRNSGCCTYVFALFWQSKLIWIMAEGGWPWTKKKLIKRYVDLNDFYMITSNFNKWAEWAVSWWRIAGAVFADVSDDEAQAVSIEAYGSDLIYTRRAILIQNITLMMIIDLSELC